LNVAKANAPPTAGSAGVDPLLPLRFARPTAATPRERPFSPGSATGAIGQEQSVLAGFRCTLKRTDKWQPELLFPTR